MSITDQLSLKAHIIANAKFLYGTKQDYEIILAQDDIPKSNPIAYLVAYSRSEVAGRDVEGNFLPVRSGNCNVIGIADALTGLLGVLVDDVAKVVAAKGTNRPFWGR